MYKMCTCSSGDRAMVSGTMWRGVEFLQGRFLYFKKTQQQMEVEIWVV